MKLFGRQKGTDSSSAYPEEIQLPGNARRTTILKLLAMIAAIVIIVVGVVLIRHDNSSNDIPQSPTTNTGSQKNPTKKAPAKSVPSSTPKSTGSSSGKSTSTAPPSANVNDAQNKSSSGAVGSSSSQLSNTGPGDVLGWAIVSSIGASALYYAVMLRRLRVD